jgi:hypothetical protein
MKRDCAATFPAAVKFTSDVAAVAATVAQARDLPTPPSVENNEPSSARSLHFMIYQTDRAPNQSTLQQQEALACTASRSGHYIDRVIFPYPLLKNNCGAQEFLLVLSVRTAGACRSTDGRSGRARHAPALRPARPRRYDGTLAEPLDHRDHAHTHTHAGSSHSFIGTCACSPFYDRPLPSFSTTPQRDSASSALAKQQPTAADGRPAQEPPNVMGLLQK